MIIIGERLNSSRKAVLSALKEKNEQFILNEALNQKKAGAHYLDLNTAALLDKEIESLRWAIPLIQKEINIPLCLDTPNPEVIAEALKIHSGQPILNSITGEKEKIKALMPLIKEYQPKVIALCLDDRGLPTQPEAELEIAQKLVEELTNDALAEEDLFIDPLVRPIGTNFQAALLFLKSLEKIKQTFPKINTIAGISNVSFGLPYRKLLNRTFLTIALSHGLDAAILDPLDNEVMASILSSQAILGKDINCSEYIKAVREKKIKI
ncbi:MAG: dihydropteroate synthase [Candidatus Aminicenantia bacterium]